MVDIRQYTEHIRNSRYGRDVREAIAAGIEAVNDDVTDQATRAEAAADRAEAIAESIPEDYTSLAEEVHANTQKNREQDGRISTNESDIAILKSAIDGNIITHESLTGEAYEVQLRSGTIGARVQAVGGKSYKSKNLANGQNLAEETVNGVTYTPIYNGTELVGIKANGTVTSGKAAYSMRIPAKLVVGQTYKVSGGIDSQRYVAVYKKDDYTMIARTGSATVSDTFTATEDGCYVYILAYSNQILENEMLYPMLTLASETDQTYEPYFEGIRNAAAEAIGNEGINIFNDKSDRNTEKGLTATNSGAYLYWVRGINTSSASGSSFVLPKGEWTVYCKVNSNAFTPKGNVYYYTDSGARTSITPAYATDTDGGRICYFDVTYERDAKFGAYFYVNTGLNGEYTMRVMVCEKSKFNLKYKPYKSEPRPLPSEILSLPNYGHGLTGASNTLHFEERVYQNMKHVNADSLNWAAWSGSGDGHQFVARDLEGQIVSSTTNILLEGYGAIPQSGGNFDKTLWVGNTGGIVLYEKTASTVAELKELLKGKVLHYEATEGGSEYRAKVYEESLANVMIEELTGWQFIEDSQRPLHWTTLPGVTTTGGDRYMPVGIAENYDPAPGNDFSSLDKVFTYAASGNSRLFIKDTSLSPADIPSGMLYFKLATPRIYDVTELLADFNPLFSTEGGGSITFDNEHQAPVPYNLYNTIKNSEAIA